MFRIVERFHTWKAQPKGSKRGVRQKESDLSQETRNRMRKRDRLTRLILDNFTEEDRYLTVTYRGKLPEVEQIRKDYRKLVRNLKAVFTRAGAELKYISLIENLTGGGRAHFHMLIPRLQGLSGAKLEKLWGKGFVKVEEYKADILDARRLAEYFTKSRTADYSSPVMPSRNLTRREPTERLMTGSTFKEEARPPAGYEELDIPGWTGSWTTEDGYPMSRKIYRRKEEPQSRKRSEKDDKRGSTGKDRGGGGRNVRRGHPPDSGGMAEK